MNSLNIVTSVLLTAVVLASTSTSVIADTRSQVSEKPCFGKTINKPCTSTGPYDPGPYNPDLDQTRAFSPLVVIGAGRAALDHGDKVGKAAGWIYCKLKGSNCGGAKK